MDLDSSGVSWLGGVSVVQECKLDLYVHSAYPKYAPRAAFDEPKGVDIGHPVWECVKTAFKVSVDC